MRKELKAIAQQRMRFEGQFERYGSKPAFRGPPLTTVLLVNVRRLDTGEVVADHLWFNETMGFISLGHLNPGDLVQFDARVSEYEKGYQGRRAERLGQDWCEIDYRLSFPTKIAKGGPAMENASARTKRKTTKPWTSIHI